MRLLLLLLLLRLLLCDVASASCAASGVEDRVGVIAENLYDFRFRTHVGPFSCRDGRSENRRCAEPRLDVSFECFTKALGRIRGGRLTTKDDSEIRRSHLVLGVLELDSVEMLEQGARGLKVNRRELPQSLLERLQPRFEVLEFCVFIQR